ncbi:hypothetical protein [Oceanicola sp. 502str15]|uniref:hypothetical protein n=1 Tax=Oceanicola sp. 502str15 TaxID=2696061 RepID=UPI00209432AB|nr:hypothetical protein [Oceanicola sp. 502str15]MCO6384466.1 hypothetical protein [Oceanicola sp. 502str15]
MVPDWLIPLLIFLLALVLIALWFRLRARRKADLAEVEPVEDVPDAAPEEPAAAAVQAEEFPPEIQAVREELSRIRSEEEAATAKEAELDSQAAARAAIAKALAEGVSEEDAKTPEATAAEGDEADPVELAEPPIATEPEQADEEEAHEEVEALAAEAEGDEPTREVMVADPLESDDRSGDVPEAEAEADELAETETENAIETPGDTDEEAAPGPEPDASDETADGDEYDSEGRIILPMAMGDIIVTTETPRRLKLSVDRQWPIPVVQGFEPETERLVVFYDGPEATDVVMLPTVQDTWQISLGGRPVVQVECAGGPEAIGTALRVRTRPAD